MLYLGLVQSLISALVFALRKPPHISNHILAGWLLIFALFFLGLLIPEGLVTYTKVGFVPFFMLTGPAFYFYVRSLIEPDFSFHWEDVPHLVPFTLVGILRMIFLPESISADVASVVERNWLVLAVIFIVSGSIIGYWLATLYRLVRHRRNVLNFFSDRSEKRSLNWVLLLMLVALLSHVLFFAAPWLEPLFPGPGLVNFWLQQFNMAMLAYLLLIFGLLQPIIFERITPPASISTGESEQKYQRSGLDTATIQQYADQVTAYLERDKPFLDPEYSLSAMIRDLNIPQQQLSQTINEAFGKNFYQLINEYRVQEFLRLKRLPTAGQYTLLALAYEAGFNSKSSFNRVFKEITGKTPSQYQ